MRIFLLSTGILCFLLAFVLHYGVGVKADRDEAAWFLLLAVVNFTMYGWDE